MNTSEDGLTKSDGKVTRFTKDGLEGLRKKIMPPANDPEIAERLGDYERECFRSILSIMKDCPGLEVVVISTYDFELDEFAVPAFMDVLPTEDPFRKTTNLVSRSHSMCNGSVIRFKSYDEPEMIRGWRCHSLYFPYSYKGENKKEGKGRAIVLACKNRVRSPGRFPRFVFQGPEGWDW